MVYIDGHAGNVRMVHRSGSRPVHEGWMQGQPNGGV